MLIVRNDENHDPVMASKENRKPLKNPELQREVRFAIGEQRCSFTRLEVLLSKPETHVDAIEIESQVVEPQWDNDVPQDT